MRKREREEGKRKKEIGEIRKGEQMKGKHEREDEREKVIMMEGEGEWNVGVIRGKKWWDMRNVRMEKREGEIRDKWREGGWKLLMKREGENEREKKVIEKCVN